MAQFMLILGGVDADKKSGTGTNYEVFLQKYTEWTKKLKDSNSLVDAHKLKDCEGRKLTLKDGKIIDGPFTETKESVGGYYIIEAKNYDEAVKIAKECPTLVVQQGYVEVREVER